MKFIRPRWRKVIRDLWSNKSRTMLVVMAIAVGIFAVGVVSGSQGTITRVLNESYASTNPPSGTVRVAGSFDDDLVATINGMDEVEVAEGRTDALLRYQLSPTSEWEQITLMVADDFGESEIAKISGEAGTWPPPEKTLVVERASLDMMGVDIGDTVLVETPAGRIRELEIAGTAHDLSGRPAALTGQPNGFVTRDTLEWLGGSRNFNLLLFIVADNKTDETHIKNVGSLIEDKFQNEGLIVPFVEIPTPGEHPINDVLEPLLLILTALSGLSLILSGLLVVNTISAMLAQQTRQIGMMKAIGARRGQIMALFFVMVFIYGLLALLIALPLGAMGAYALTTFLLDFFNTDLDSFTIPTSVLALQIAIGLLVPVVVAIYPIVSGTRITVREAVSDYGVGKGKYGTSLLDRLLRYFKGVSRPMLISLRNTFRRKGRLTLTLLTLTLAGTTFITIFSTRDSMMATLDDLMATFGFDAVVIFDREYRSVQFDRATDQMPNVEAAESWGQATVNRVYANGETGDDVTLESPPVNSIMINPEIVEGRWLQPDDGNALVVNTDFMDDESDLKVGDEIVLELNSRDTTWQIVGVVQGTMFGSTVYANEPYFSRLTGNVGKSNVVRLSLANPTEADPDMLTQTLQDQFADAGLEPQRVMSLSQMQAMMETTFNFLISFLLAMAVVLAAVGGLGLSGTMSINVLERVREIGVMRAIGASDSAVLRLVLVEGIIIGIISWFAGAIIAVPLSLVISNLLGISLISQPLTYAYSIMGLGLWLVVAIILAAVASFFPARNASQLTVREVLAYE